MLTEIMPLTSTKLEQFQVLMACHLVIDVLLYQRLFVKG